MKTRSLAQAILDESHKPIEAQSFSHMRLEYCTAAEKSSVRRTRGNDKGRSVGRRSRSVYKTRTTPWQHNTTTDTATGYTNRRDFQAKAMGMGPSFTFATAVGAATASSATTLTNTGAAFPTAGQALAGQLVCCWISTTVMVYGVILSNTATVLTVDQWYNAASATGAVGTTPAATAPYAILPGQNPASWLALSSDVTTPTSAYTTLVAELTTNGFARAVGTYAHTAAATTYTLTKLFTASGTSTINTEGVFGAAVSATGVLPFVAPETSPPTLVSGDTLTQTVTVTIN